MGTVLYLCACSMFATSGSHRVIFQFAHHAGFHVISGMHIAASFPLIVAIPLMLSLLLPQYHYVYGHAYPMPLAQVLYQPQVVDSVLLSSSLTTTCTHYMLRVSNEVLTVYPHRVLSCLVSDVYYSLDVTPMRNAWYLMRCLSVSLFLFDCALYLNALSINCPHACLPYVAICLMRQITTYRYVLNVIVSNLSELHHVLRTRVLCQPTMPHTLCSSVVHCICSLTAYRVNMLLRYHAVLVSTINVCLHSRFPSCFAHC